jgi:diguanylate cyclase (GGDEF)-like protein/PAS domain S-box-containing protein
MPVASNPVSVLNEVSAAVTYDPTPLSVATAVAAVAILVLGSAVLIRGRKWRASRFFFLVTVTNFGWLGGFAAMYAAQTPAAALFWGKIGHFFAAIIPAAVFHFATEFLGRGKRYRGWTAGFWLLCGAMAIISAGTGLLIRSVRRFSWGFYPIAQPANAILVLTCAAILVASIYLFWRAYRESEGPAKERAATLLLAFVLGFLGLLDYIPSLGIPLHPVGFMACVAFIVVAATAMWRFELADLTPEYAAAQILETMKGAVVVVDMHGAIRVVNRAACHLLGYKPEQLVGQHLRTVLYAEQNMTTGQLLNSMGVLEHAMVWQAADGTRIDVLSSSSFVRDPEGAPVGVVYVASDFTERKKAEQALRESEHRYRTLFDANPLPMWIYDFESLRFIAVNDAAVEHYGFKRHEFLKMTIADIRPAEDVPLLRARVGSVESFQSSSQWRHRKKDGTIIDVDVRSFEFLTGGKKARLVIAQDITDRKRAEEELRRSEERFRELFETSRANEVRFRNLFERNLAGVYRTTEDGRILDCNDACARIFGFDSREELLSAEATSFYFDAGERERVLQILQDQHSLSNNEMRMRRRDGTVVWVLENVSLLRGDGEPGVLEGTLIDITDRKYAQEQIEYQAYHDVLTGLPNRLLFRDRISIALAHARRTGRSVAVMFLDLDQFKLVNDTLGHTVGDRLLQAIGARLVSCVRAEDTVARMGGDEFTILLSDLIDRRGAATVALKVLDAVRHPVTVDQHELFVSTSIGISMFPDDGDDAETLLKNADRAMYHAKELGRDNYQYATATAQEGEGRLALERSLHHALERGELVVHYQPMVEIATGSVVGAEALVRWNHPERGMVQPEEFIPVAEETQLIVPIGEWVMRTACAQMKAWHDAGHDWLRIAVNLSPRQFQHRDLSTTIERVLEETGFPPTFLELEITESTAMQNVDLSLSVLNRLKEMGLRISIDDFGTGYSSLSYLKRLPVDTVKIDQYFVRDLTAENGDTAIITAVIWMARALNLRVIAEGVETEEQLAFLRREQCAEMQGFLHSEPMPAAEFEEALRAVSRG